MARLHASGGGTTDSAGENIARFFRLVLRIVLSPLVPCRMVHSSGKSGEGGGRGGGGGREDGVYTIYYWLMGRRDPANGTQRPCEWDNAKTLKTRMGRKNPQVLS
jgi:hypothetical protein